MGADVPEFAVVPELRHTARGCAMRRVEVVNRRVLLDDFFRVDEAQLRYERFDGTLSEEVRRLSFERGDSVAALLLNRDTQRVILVDQFKFPTYANGPGWLVEVVAGTVGRDEDPSHALRREILEETGYEVGDLTHIATFYVSPGGSSERIILYYGEVDAGSRVSSGGGLPEEGEDIQVLEWSLPDLWRAIDQHALEDAKTLIAAMWLRARLSR
jgi:nudix-type nucleoside diphosphatase (YffH/AdpP family)